MMLEWFVIIAAGFLGGLLNAVAGGGSFITLPALIFVGVPPVAANATGTAALLPGYIASAWRFRRDIERPAALGYPAVIAIALLGGTLGALVLLSTSDRLFAVLIPWLILLATGMFLFAPTITRLGHARRTARAASARISEVGTTSVDSVNSGAAESGGTGRQIIAGVTLGLVCVYGGYFNGGLGIILLAALGLIGQTNLLGMNGLKNLISAVLTAIAVVVYALGNTIAYGHVLVLGLAAVCGGYAGAALAYRIPQGVLRAVIVMIGISMAIGFFYSGGGAESQT